MVKPPKRLKDMKKKKSIVDYIIELEQVNKRLEQIQTDPEYINEKVKQIYGDKKYTQQIDISSLL